jgi:hypothetical protein
MLECSGLPLQDLEEVQGVELLAILAKEPHMPGTNRSPISDLDVPGVGVQQ